MARTELTTGSIHIYLSRRNLLALLHKLDMAGSARTLENNHVVVDGKLSRDHKLFLHAEDDLEHYAHPDRINGHPPGKLHPETEAFVCAFSPSPTGDLRIDLSQQFDELD